MVTIKIENTRPFDIDDTLILLPKHDDPADTRYVYVTDPVYPHGELLKFRVHEPMVRLLKEEATRGSFVIVHSRGGYQWAQNVIDALGLRQYVNLCMSKPLVYFDDTPVELWLKDRVYIDPNTRYKR